MHVGDEVIVTIAETIRANPGANVSASRISGDRFALLLRIRPLQALGHGISLDDFGQGFAIGRPRPVEQVLQDLLRGQSEWYGSRRRRLPRVRTGWSADSAAD